MRILRWAGVNAGLFVAASLVLVLGWGPLQRALGNEPPGVIGRALFAWGFFLALLIPFLAAYLLVIALFPARWSPGTQRVAAVLLGQVGLVVFLLTGLLEVEGPGGALGAVAVFSLPGLIVRLPDWKTPA